MHSLALRYCLTQVVVEKRPLNGCFCFEFKLTTTALHPFNGLFSRTTWVSWYQNGKTSLDLNEERDAGVWGWQWHQLDDMQTICTSLQADKPHQHLIIFTLSEE